MEISTVREKNEWKQNKTEVLDERINAQITVNVSTKSLSMKGKKKKTRMRVRENEISQKHGKQIKCKKWIVHYFNSFWAQVVNFGKVRQDSFQTDRQTE